MGNIGMSSIQYTNIEDEKEEVITNTIITSCLDEEELEERLENKNYCDAVLMVCLSKESNQIYVTLTREYNPISGHIWSFPVATTEDNKNIKETISREVKNKTNLNASLKNIIIQKPTYSNENITDQRISVAFIESSGVVEENNKVKLFTLDEVKELLSSNDEVSNTTRLILSILCLADGDISKIVKYL